MNYTRKIEDNQKFVIILFLVILVVSNSIIGFYAQDYENRISLSTDETRHISAARSFQDGRNFDIDYIPGEIDLSVSTLVELYPPEISQPYKRPITYHALLASFFTIFGTTIEDQLIHASIFNNIIGSIFIIIFFIVIKKYFSLQTAILSSFIVLFSGSFISNTVRALPIGLFYVCAISALCFLETKKTHYILFGVFTGLSHMGSAAGIVLGFVYFSYLIFKREFKGAFIVFLSWNAILLPIYLRNYYISKDFGAGLYIPFSDIISKFLYFLPSKIIESNGSNILHFVPNVMNTKGFTLTNYLQQIYAHGVDENSIYFIWFIIFGTVAFFISKIMFKHVTFSRIYYLIFLYSVLNISALFFFNIHTGFDPGFKHLTFAFFLLVPIALFGFENILDKIKPRRFIVNLKMLSLVLTLLIISPMMIQSVYVLKNFDNSGIRLFNVDELDEDKKISSYLKQNLPHDAVIASNNPGNVHMRTGFKSITIPTDLKCNNLDKFLEHFNIRYVMLYPDVSSYPIVDKFFVNSSIKKISFKHVTDFNTDTHQLFEVIAITPLEKINLLKTFENARNFESQGRYDVALMNYNLITNTIQSEIKTLSSLYWYCDDELNVDEVLAVYLNSVQNKMIIFEQQNNDDEAINSLKDLIFFYETLIQHEPRYPELYTIDLKKNYVQILFDAAKFYEAISHETMAIQTYQKIITFDRSNVDAMLKIARLYEKTESFWQSLNTYEKIFQFNEDPKILSKIEELKSKIES